MIEFFSKTLTFANNFYIFKRYALKYICKNIFLFIIMNYIDIYNFNIFKRNALKYIKIQ